MKDLDSATIVADIEARAAAAGISITALCLRAGISRTTFQRMRTGRSSPTLRVLRKLYAALPDTEQAA